MSTVAEKKWYALRCKARSEKWLQERMFKMDLEAYVPVQEQVKKYERKTRTILKPLITGYIFPYIDKSQFAQVYDLPYIGKFVTEYGKPVIIPQEEIDMLKRITGEIIASYNLDLQYEAGELIEIISGNLAGIKARILRLNGKKRIIIELHSIAIGLEVQVQANQIVKA